MMPAIWSGPGLKATGNEKYQMPTTAAAKKRITNHLGLGGSSDRSGCSGSAAALGESITPALLRHHLPSSMAPMPSRPGINSMDFSRAASIPIDSP